MYDDRHASAFLKVALEAASRAADISRSYYAGNFTVTTKDDLTPVTQADVECEQKIREIILGRFPDHGFFGEETGRTRDDADSLWLVDPIDGTKGFVRQYPFFSTQIALMRGGQIVLGVSSGTMMNELAWAEQGRGAWLNGKRMTVSDIDDIDRSAVSTGNLKSLAMSPGWDKLGEVVAAADRIRGYGDFYHYHLLAAGNIWQAMTGTEAEQHPFRVRIVAPGTQPFSCGNRIPVNPDCPVSENPEANVLILPELWLGPDEDIRGRYPELMEWIRNAYHAGASIYSACSGAVMLAETGLLDGCDATSHWGYQDLFRQRYPKVRFRPEPNLVFCSNAGSYGGTIWTTANNGDVLEINNFGVPGQGGQPIGSGDLPDHQEPDEQYQAAGAGVGDAFPVANVSWDQIAGQDGFVDRLNGHLVRRPLE